MGAMFETDEENWRARDEIRELAVVAAATLVVERYVRRVSFCMGSSWGRGGRFIAREGGSKEGLE